jgi:hypothetical protein
MDSGLVFGIFFFLVTGYIMISAVLKGERSWLIQHSPFNPNNKLGKKTRLFLLGLSLVVSIIKLLDLFGFIPHQ